MEPYYYGHKSAPIGRRSGHCVVFVYNTSFALTLTYDLDLQFPASYGQLVMTHIQANSLVTVRS